MKDFYKAFQYRKYQLILVYFNFVIILNLLARVFDTSSSTSAEQSSHTQTQTQSNNNASQNKSNASNKVEGQCNELCWGGYLVALIFLNSLLFIKCKMIQEKWYFWIKQSFLAVTLLLVILVMNLTTNYQTSNENENETQQNLNINNSQHALFYDIKYQTGQFSLFSLISLIEVLPFQLLLLLVNQIYFIFIRMEIYSNSSSDQIAFFGLYFSSIGILIFLQRFQARMQLFQNDKSCSQNVQMSSIKIKQKNMSSIYIDCQQEPIKNSQTNRSCNHNDNDTGYFHERKNQDGSYTICRHLQRRDTQNIITSRPTSHKNTNGRDITSQINDSTNNYTKKDFEDQDHICQSSIATYGMKNSNDIQLFNSHHCSVHREQVPKGLLQRNKSNSIDNMNKSSNMHHDFQQYYEQEKDSSECIFGKQTERKNDQIKSVKQNNKLTPYNNMNNKNIMNTNNISNNSSLHKNQCQDELQHECSVANITFNKSNNAQDCNISSHSFMYQQKEFCNQSRDEETEENHKLENPKQTAKQKMNFLNVNCNNKYSNSKDQSNENLPMNTNNNRITQTNLSNFQLNYNSNIINRSNQALSQDLSKKPSIFLKRCKSMDNQIPTQCKLSKYSKMEQVNSEQTTKQVKQEVQQKEKYGGNSFMKSFRDSEFSSARQISHRNLSIIYQVFFNFFPEGNNSSKLLLDCKDNAQLKDVIFNLPNLKTEIDQTTQQQQQQQGESQYELKNKVSFESFRHLNLGSPKSTSDQMFNFNQQNIPSVNSNQINTNITLTTNNSVHQNDKINRSRYSINEEQSPKKNYPKLSQLLGGAGGGYNSPYQKINQMGDNVNSFQNIKLEKVVSNQVNLQTEILKNLFKTQQFIHQNNMESVDSNMILNETIIINSKYKKSNLNTHHVNLQHQNNLHFQNTSINQIYYPANSNLQNNSQQSIKNQIVNQNNINTSSPGINTHSANGSNLLNYNQKERNGSFQFGVIANSIYGSTFMNNNNNNNNNTNNLNTNSNNQTTFNNSNTLNPNSPLQQNLLTNLSSQYPQQSSNINILLNSNAINQSGGSNLNANQVNQYTSINANTHGTINNQPPQINQSINRKSSIQFINTVNGGTATGINQNVQNTQNTQQNNQNQYNYSFMNFQVSQQFLERGGTQHQQENINDNRELEISLFPSVVEGRAMMLLMIRDVTHRKYIQHLKMANLHKQQIVSYLSHELRNPLNCIINMLDTVDYDVQVLKRIDQNIVNIEEIENNIATALQNSKYILNLSNDYLDMARIRADQFKLNIQPFNLLNLLKDCMKLFTIQAYKVNTQIVLKNRSIKNTFYYDTTSQFQNMVYSDPERIKQVVINLISNALKFTHNGRIFIIAEYITISSIQISIKDTGIGIEKSKVKSLFKAFGKIEDEETQNYNQQGVGLGLLISNMLSIQLSKPPILDNQNNNNNNNNNPINQTSLMNINISNQTIPLQSQNQQNLKQERGLKVESEKGIGSTFTLTVTDHNPYYKLNKNLGRQAIQQIAETQESSALLSQSLYENPLAKKSQFEKDPSLTNQKTYGNILGSSKNKKSSQLIPCTQSQTNCLQVSSAKSYKKQKKESRPSIEKSKSSIILDCKNNNQNYYFKNAQSSSSLTQISQTDFSENINELQSQFIICKSQKQQLSPLKIVHKHNNNLNMSESSSPSPNQIQFNFKREKITQQFTIESQHEIPNQLANIVKYNPCMKNKFINNQQSKTDSHQPSISTNFTQFLTPLTIPLRKTSHQARNSLASPQSSPLNSALRTPKQCRLQSTFSAQNKPIEDEEILIVDDNIFCCEALKNIIEKRFGIKCMMCFSAMRAVEIVKEKFSSFKQVMKTRSKKVTYCSDDQESDKSEHEKNNIEISIVLQNPSKKETTSLYNLSNKNVGSEDIISENRFFKFIFLDINMPDVNGFEGLYQIKSFLNQVYPNFSEKCQIIGCSGIDENYLEDQYHSNNNPLAQFDNFLFKPVLKEKLIEFFASYNIKMMN